jgi:hypothetical protein
MSVLDDWKLGLPELHGLICVLLAQLAQAPSRR